MQLHSFIYLFKPGNLANFKHTYIEREKKKKVEKTSKYMLSNTLNLQKYSNS